MKKIIFSFLLLFTLLFTKEVSAYALDSKTSYVYLGGETIGIKLNTGVKVIKTFAIVDGIDLLKPWEDAGIMENDIIVSYDNVKIDSTSKLLETISKSSGKESDIILSRNDKEIKTKITPVFKNDTYSLGIYVKDNISGIGTLTYIIPDINIFGALGHQIDGAKNVDGLLYEASVTGIKKGTAGEAGSKQANIKTKKIGKIEKNTITGLHGTYNGLSRDKPLISLAKKEEVSKGYAQIVTCIDGDKVEYFDIEIIALEKQKSQSIKGIRFKVTDKKLIEKTNGIVQGMSGSPIIQNDKLIGAVTHVLVSNPHEGYGIYVEFMLEDMGVDLT